MSQISVRFVEEHYKLLEEDITDSEWIMQNATGRKSKCRLEKTYGKNPTLSIYEYRAFFKKWPHMNDLGECERPDYNFSRIGDLVDYHYCDSDLDYWVLDFTI